MGFPSVLGLSLFSTQGPLTQISLYLTLAQLRACPLTLLLCN